MTDDASTHRPDLEKDGAVVGAILARHLDAIQTCGQLVFAHVTTEANVDREPRAFNHHVIEIGVADAKQLPAGKALYLDGVRVFFAGGGRTVPE